ncbi:MAG: hypothetical protein Q8R79_06950 [Legionellaceae bacterium]|nr:hypothetical protein [Legionellaceae bacterium]
MTDPKKGADKKDKKAVSFDVAGQLPKITRLSPGPIAAGLRNAAQAERERTTARDAVPPSANRKSNLLPKDDETVELRQKIQNWLSDIKKIKLRSSILTRPKSVAEMTKEELQQYKTRVENAFNSIRDEILLECKTIESQIKKVRGDKKTFSVDTVLTHLGLKTPMDSMVLQELAIVRTKLKDILATDKGAVSVERRTLDSKLSNLAICINFMTPEDQKQARQYQDTSKNQNLTREELSVLHQKIGRLLARYSVQLEEFEALKKACETEIRYMGKYEHLGTQDNELVLDECVVSFIKEAKERLPKIVSIEGLQDFHFELQEALGQMNSPQMQIVKKETQRLAGEPEGSGLEKAQKIEAELRALPLEQRVYFLEAPYGKELRAALSAQRSMIQKGVTAAKSHLGKLTSFFAPSEPKEQTHALDTKSRVNVDKMLFKAKTDVMSEIADQLRRIYPHLSGKEAPMFQLRKLTDSKDPYSAGNFYLDDNGKFATNSKDTSPLLNPKDHYLLGAVRKFYLSVIYGEKNVAAGSENKGPHKYKDRFGGFIPALIDSGPAEGAKERPVREVSLEELDQHAEFITQLADQVDSPDVKAVEVVIKNLRASKGLFGKERQDAIDKADKIQSALNRISLEHRGDFLSNQYGEEVRKLAKEHRNWFDLRSGEKTTSYRMLLGDLRSTNHPPPEHKGPK